MSLNDTVNYARKITSTDSGPGEGTFSKHRIEVLSVELSKVKTKLGSFYVKSYPNMKIGKNPYTSSRDKTIVEIVKTQHSCIAC